MKSLRDDCEEEQYCGLPLFMTRMVPLSPNSHWIPAEAPEQPINTELVLIGGKNCNIDNLTCSLTFDLKG